MPDVLHAPWTGVVVVAIAPVSDEQTLNEIADAIAGIRTVQHVALHDIEHERVRLSLSLSRPTMLAEELQHALADRVLRCRTDGGSLAVTLHRRDRIRDTATTRLFDHVATSHPLRPPGARRLIATGDAAAHELTAELIDGALRAITGVSIVVLDQTLRVKALAGPLVGQIDRPVRAALGRALVDVLPEHLLTPLAGPCWAALGRRRTTTDLELLDGTVALRAETVPIEHEDTVIGVLIAVHEIAADPGAALVDLAEIFRLTFAQAQVAQALIAPDGRIVRANHALADLCGKTEQELLGISISDLSRRPDPSNPEHDVRDQTTPVTLVRADGTLVRVTEHRVWSRDRNGNLRGAALHFTPSMQDPTRADRGVTR